MNRARSEERSPSARDEARGESAAATVSTILAAGISSGAKRRGGGEQRETEQRGGHYGWGKADEHEDEGKEPGPDKVKANFGLSGALAKDVNTGNVYKGILLKWSEPSEARAPTKRWRLYVFKGGDVIDTLHVHRQSAYLVGREEKIADILVEHPSCSKQHAVLQFRLKEKVDEKAMTTTRSVKPYIMDLDSTNGTFLNGKRIEGSRYVELMEKDCLKFGNSSREYVLLHDKSKSDT
jgi:smad nuclear-interacting protein 1